MFKIFRVFLLISVFISSSLVMASDRSDEEIARFSSKSAKAKSNESKLKDSIKQIESKLQKKSITIKEKKELLKQREDAVLDKWRIKTDFKRDNNYLRHLRSRKFKKIDLKITPKGICNNPCQVTMEAIAESKIKSIVSKYIFYIDDKKIESLNSKLTTTIYFSLSMLTNKQQKLLNRNVPLHKIFKIKAEGIISEDTMVKSETKKLVIKSKASNLTNIELVTKAVMPMSKIQIAISGINATELSGTIGGFPIKFQIDNSIGSSNIMSAIMPYSADAQLKLAIANFNFNIDVISVPQVVNSSAYVQGFSNASLELSNTIITGPKFNELIGSDGVAVLSSFNEVLKAFDDYIKNEASPAQIQQIANLINATLKSDENVFYFVKNSKNSKELIHQAITSNLLPKEILGKMFGLIIQDSYAQDAPADSLKKFLMAKITKSIEMLLSLGLTGLMEGQIDKCYISKGRIIPPGIKANEYALNALLAGAVGLVATGQIAGVAGYISTIAGIDALIVLIGLDCQGDSTIDPKLVINSQPTLPIIPGESINYNVKCDVGDERYYAPNSLPIKVTSRFDYKVPSFVDAGVSTSADKLLNGCSGLGQEVIKNEHDISCTTNLLQDTQFYQDNIDQYETFNPAACNGVGSYTAGINLVISSSLSCDFVNSEESVFIPGKPVKGNDLVFNLTKKWNCPKAVISYTKNNLAVNFDSTGNTDLTGLTYSWSFGDGQTSTEKSPNHTYSQAGTYPVLLTVTDAYGAESSSRIDVSVISSNTASVTYCNISTSRGTMYFLVNESEEFYLSRTNDACECHTFQVPRGQYSSIYGYFELDGYPGYLESMDYEESIFGEDNIQYYRGGFGYVALYIFKIPPASLDFYKNSCAAIVYK